MEQEELLHFPAPEPEPEQDIFEDEEGNYRLQIPETFKFHEQGPSFHQENLADKLEESVLSRIAQELYRAIEDDDDSREEWRTDMAEGMELRGRKIEDRSYPYEGAAGVYDSALEQAILTTAATIVSELLPPKGPAKGSVMGAVNAQSSKDAESMGEMYNDYFTRVNKAFYPDFEQAIYNWIVPTGFAAVKSYKNPVTNIPDSFHIEPDDFIVNTSATSLDVASRITHVLRLPYREMKLRQMSGLYRDIDISADTYQEDDKSIVQQIQENQEGRQVQSYEFNKQYTLYECHTYIELEKYQNDTMQDKKEYLPKPYIITLDKQTQKVLSIYRNWEEHDPTFKRIEYFVIFKFIPSYGIYGAGFFHLASGNAKAATMVRRMLLDAGMLSNFPGGVRVKGMRIEENNIRVGPTEFIEIETGGLPIQQAIMPLPYKDPNPILKELGDDLSDNIMKLAGASMTSLEDISPNMPVGTILAVFESNNRIQSAVLQRLYRSMGDLFDILYRLFKDSIHDEPYEFTTAGKAFQITKEHFKNNIKVIPCADPNLSSFAQRAMTVETMLNTAKEFPDLHDMRAVLKSYYQILKVPNIDEIMPEEPEVKPLDPISENSNAMNGQPLKAFIIQDHASHKILHQSVMENPELDPQIAQALQAHIQEHSAFEYMIQMQQMLGIQIPEDPYQLDPEQQNQIAMMAAQAIMQQQQEQQQQQPPPLTPEEVMMEEVKVKDKQVDLQHEYDMKKLEVEDKRLEIERMKLVQKDNFDEKKLALEEKKIDQQAETEELKAETASYEAHVKHEIEMEKLHVKPTFTSESKK